jgi:hypothetical protein
MQQTFPAAASRCDHHQRLAIRAFDTTRQNNAVNRACHNDHIGKCSSGVGGYSVTHATSLLLDPNAVGNAAIVNARTVPEVRADVDTA